MKVEEYESLLSLCNECIRLQKDLTTAEAKRFPSLTFEAVLSVFRQQYQRHIKKTAHVHRSESALSSYVEKYEAGQGIWDIAEGANFSPYLMSRLLVQRMCGIDKRSVGRLMKDPSMIEDERLRDEVQYCIDMDQYCSPFIDRVKLAVGNEYEYVLQQCLRNRGIPFESEDDLRARGFSKTPDVRLTVPIGVAAEDGSPRVVNWIDSKAMFGDRHAHETEISPQLVGYVNRFGPGMVIYWFDFVESLNSDPDVLVSNQFPDVIVLPGATCPVPELGLATALAREGCGWVEGDPSMPPGLRELGCRTAGDPCTTAGECSRSDDTAELKGVDGSSGSLDGACDPALPVPGVAPGAGLSVVSAAKPPS